MVVKPWPTPGIPGTWLSENLAFVHGSVTDNVAISVNATTGSPITLNLVVGQEVSATYDSHTMTLQGLMVVKPWPTPVTSGTWTSDELAFVHGSITDNITISISATTGSPITLNLAAGQEVTAAYDSQTMALQWLVKGD